MGFWSLDEKSQLALLVAGLVGGAGLTGCDDKPVVVDPVPGDARVEQLVMDPPPPDFRTEQQIADPVPRDFRVDRQVTGDPAPRDFRLDQPLVVDMLPPDASTSSQRPPPAPQAGAAGQALPLARDLRAQIVAQHLPGGVFQLQARSSLEGRQLTYRWKASGGQLDRSNAASVRWTPATTPGTQMVQLTVRDGDRAVAVEVFLHTVR